MGATPENKCRSAHTAMLVAPVKSLYSNVTLTDGSNILTNIFRQLIVPWLLCAVVAGVFLLMWYHSANRNQQMQQIQQLAVATSYAVQASLAADSPQVLADKLEQIYYSSAQLVQFIAVYDAQLQLIASSGTVEPASTLNFATEFYQVKTLPDATQLTVLPLSAGISSRQLADTEPLPESGYLAIRSGPDAATPVWLMPVSLLIVAMVMGLLISIRALKHAQQRLILDTELMVHHWQRLQNTGQYRQIDEPLLPVLKPLQQAFNALAEVVSQKQQMTEQLIPQLNQQLQQAERQQTELQQQQQQIKASQQRQQAQLQHWFAESLLLWQRAGQLPPDQLRRLTQMHLLAGSYQFTDKNMHGQPLVLCNWLGEHLDELNGILPSGAVSLDWLEHPANLACTLSVCHHTLSSLLQALLMLCLRVEDVSKIAVAVQLEDAELQPVLKITARCNGNGLSDHCRELITAADLSPLSWCDSNIALLIAVQRAGARFTAQSLDGLGCILQLAIPVQTERLSVAKEIQQIVLFDSNAERGQQHANALNGLAGQVTLCNRLSELEPLIESRIVDLVLIFLPPAAASSAWQKIQHVLQQQPCVLCFAAAGEVQTWQRSMPNVLANQQFCLAEVQAKAGPRPNAGKQQHILVVDDNETNLAFVQVLLKNKPLILHTATSASQVFSLCHQQQFDMILLDIQLPDISGVDVAKQLRQMPEYQQVPIVAFTAHATPAEIESYREAGMDDIIFKPLEPSRLDSLLARFALATRQH